MQNAQSQSHAQRTFKPEIHMLRQDAFSSLPSVTTLFPCSSSKPLSIKFRELSFDGKARNLHLHAHAIVYSSPSSPLVITSNALRNFYLIPKLAMNLSPAANLALVLQGTPFGPNLRVRVATAIIRFTTGKAITFYEHISTR